MKASQLKQMIESSINRHGDLEVFMLTDHQLLQPDFTHSFNDWEPEFLEKLSGQTLKHDVFIIDGITGGIL